MKILHVADLHLGKSVNGFSQLEDQRHILEQILGIMDERRVDVLLMAGDIYDKTQPSAEAVALLDWFLTQLAQRDVHAIGIPGNHDSTERIAYGARMLEASGVHLAPLYDGAIAPVTLADEHGPVRFWPLPFLRPAQVRAHFPGREQEIGTSFTRALEAVIAQLDLDPAERNVALAHQFVTAGDGDDGGEADGEGLGDGAADPATGLTANPIGGARATEPELPLRSDSEAFVGTLDNVDAALFASFDYTALGHLHRAQRVGSDTVRYAGSPLKYSASEAPWPKSVPLITLGPKDGADTACARIDLVELTPLRDTRVIAGPLERLVAPEVVGAASAHDYIHAVLTDDVLPMNARLTLRAAYPNLMTLVHKPASLEAHGGPADAARDGSNSLEGSSMDAAGANPLELFERLYRLQNGVGLSEAEEAVVRAALDAAFTDDGSLTATGTPDGSPTATGTPDTQATPDRSLTGPDARATEGA